MEGFLRKTKTGLPIHVCVCMSRTGSEVQRVQSEGQSDVTV